MKKKTRDNDFHDYVVHDVLAGEPGITSKPMFGGWGVYRDGKIFAIVSGSEFFLRAESKAAKEFFESKEDSYQFHYKRSGRSEPVYLQYWSVPEEVLEDRELFEEWMDMARSG